MHDRGPELFGESRGYGPDRFLCDRLCLVPQHGVYGQELGENEHGLVAGKVRKSGHADSIKRGNRDLAVGEAAEGSVKEHADVLVGEADYRAGYAVQIGGTDAVVHADSVTGLSRRRRLRGG